MTFSHSVSVKNTSASSYNLMILLMASKAWSIAFSSTKSIDKSSLATGMKACKKCFVSAALVQDPWKREAMFWSDHKWGGKAPSSKWWQTLFWCDTRPYHKDGKRRLLAHPFLQRGAGAPVGGGDPLPAVAWWCWGSSVHSSWKQTGSLVDLFQGCNCIPSKASWKPNGAISNYCWKTRGHLELPTAPLSKVVPKAYLFQGRKGIPFSRVSLLDHVLDAALFQGQQSSNKSKTSWCPMSLHQCKILGNQQWGNGCTACLAVATSFPNCTPWVYLDSDTRHHLHARTMEWCFSSNHWFSWDGAAAYHHRVFQPVSKIFQECPQERCYETFHSWLAWQTSDGVRRWAQYPYPFSRL